MTDRVNVNISDLFFNRDFNQAEIKDIKGKFQGWNDEIMHEYAQDTLDNIKGLGVIDLPTPKELLADFYERV